MPFHLEKGRLLMAIESLLNDPIHDAALGTAATELAAGDPARTVLNNAAVATGNPKFVTYMDNVTKLWFDPASPYWIDYSGNVDEIVRRALLWAMQRAWGWNGRPDSFPGLGQRTREIHLWWHCSQRWFEAWLSWESAISPVQVLFATPPQTGGLIWADIDKAAQQGDAHRLKKVAESKKKGDMVLVSQPFHVPTKVDLTGPTESGVVPIPAAGVRYVDSGDVKCWSIPTKAGGMNPEKGWP